MELLRELTCLDGVSGDEKDVRNLIYDKIKDDIDSYNVDNIGNLIALKKTRIIKNNNPLKIMLAAHMDEVGFMVSGITEHGLIRFFSIGSIDERIIPGCTMIIGKNKIPGIAEFINSADNKISLNNLVIDIGAKSYKETSNYINLGDFISFKSESILLRENILKAKALDDRAGCAVLIDMLKESYDFDLYACFTVQEEIGLLGAAVASYSVNPDIAFIVEGTTCSDLDNVDPVEYSTILGEGPAVSIMDKSTIYNNSIRDFIIKVAKENQIKLQIKNTFTGGNDSAKIQRSNKGVLVEVISIPVRYIHSPNSIMNMNDFIETKKLLSGVLREVRNLLE